MYYLKKIKAQLHEAMRDALCLVLPPTSCHQRGWGDVAPNSGMSDFQAIRCVAATGNVRIATVSDVIRVACSELPHVTGL